MSDLSNNQALFEVFSALEEVRAQVNAKGEDLSSMVQVCVVGRENSGKSSLLTMISGVLFPNGGGKGNTGCCTRCPIVVEMRRDPTMADGDKRIEIDGRVYTAGQEQDVCNYLQNRMDTLAAGNRFDHRPIRVVVSGAKLNFLTLIDLPGLIDQEKIVTDFEEDIKEDEIIGVEYDPETAMFTDAAVIGGGVGVGVGGAEMRGSGIPQVSHKQKIDDMVNLFIKKENTIIVVVQRANATHHGERALELAQAADPSWKRTLKVMTRCDELVNEEDIQRASKRLTDTEDLDSGLGWHGVACRIAGKDTTFEQENETLNTFFAGRTNIGTSTLQNRLTELLVAKLKYKSMDLKMEIERKLNQLSFVTMRPSVILETVSDEIGKYNAAIKSKLSDLLLQLKDDLLDMKKNLTRDLITKDFAINIFTNPIFQGGDHFERKLRFIVRDMWHPRLVRFLHELLAIVVYLPEAAFGQTGGILKNQICRSWAREYHEIRKQLTQHCLEIEIDKQKLYGTMRDTRLEKTLGNEEIVEAFIKTLQSQPMTNPAMTAAQITLELGKVLSSALDKCRGSGEGGKSRLRGIKEIQGDRIYNAVLCYYPIMVENFTEQILGNVNRLVVQPREKWTKSTLIDNPDFIKHATESIDAVAERERVDECEKAMQVALQKLEEFAKM